MSSTRVRPASADDSGSASAVPPYQPSRWHRDHRFALAGIVGATALTWLAGALGPSAVTLTLGRRRSLLPPWYLPTGFVRPHEWFVSGLIWVAILVGALGLGIALRALADGWLPRVRRVFALGTALSLVTITVPPMTSADVLMYAAYGRLQALGRNPYDITPAEVIRGQFDPVMRWVEFPWTDTPSVYGPITSWTQLMANRLGGENMHDIVFWLQVSAVVPFVLACAGVVTMAAGDPGRQARAAVLTIANPMLIWAVLAGAHNEALSVMFAVGGVMMLRRSPFAAGLGIGLAGCAKLSIGIWGLAMLWSYRREPKKAALLCLGTAIPMGLAYGLWAPTAFVQVLRNGSYVSVGSWANPVFRFLDLFVTGVTAKIVVGIVAYAGLIAIAWMLSRVVGWTPAPGLPEGADARLDPLTVTLRTALVLSVAWLITSMYTLAWYDLIAWMPLALVAASKLDRIMLLRITPLSLAYVPGRAIDYGPALDFTANRVRDTISPIFQMLVLVAVVLWWRKPEREELLPFRSPPPAER
ncbi:MAG TPA: polyprenol phosphomannose-dependent alpha 1,6 mannosyltransferase MptB [Propionibacteriaceae bacterium]|nr:polyprenol phosphomannose-dependent alpha 1,6 mannosyltransferase MptB [Propionibacteriaceae bacterium]